MKNNVNSVKQKTFVRSLFTVIKLDWSYYLCKGIGPSRVGAKITRASNNKTFTFANNSVFGSL